MDSETIRSTFFRFFDQLDHRRMPPGPLVPDDDSGMLFTGAGMVQFRPYFTGESEPPWPRLTSSQPCVRTVDIDNIGRTMRHATSFEMLGNFSFGAYFKLEAMSWAWDLLINGYGLDRDRLWVTVHVDDGESFELWRRIGVPTSRIQRLGPQDNFWSMGVPGPAGPNSEIFYDRGDRFGDDGGPAVSGDRYLEIWGLVFMQYLRGDSDEEIIGLLPGRYVDTGMGLDRIAMILQEVDHIQRIDVSVPTLERVLELTGHGEETVSHRIVSDHLRTSMLLLEHGIRPGNEGRGYVLRRLLRRAMRHLQVVGVMEPVLGRLTGSEVIAREEIGFARALRRGSRLLDKEVRHGWVSGEAAFRLHDTHGFPIDLTVEVAQERGVGVDVAEFKRLMSEHRRRSVPR